MKRLIIEYKVIIEFDVPNIDWEYLKEVEEKVQEFGEIKIIDIKIIDSEKKSK